MSLYVEVSHNFKLHVAIDFGTDGMAVAYAFEGVVTVHNKWDTDNYGTTKKLKTIILLDDNGEMQDFGMDAKYTYMELNGSKRDKWMLFERFKMLLYEDELNYEDDEKKENENAHRSKIGIKDKLTALNKQEYSSEAVFITTFATIQEMVRSYLKRKQVNVTSEETQWIITVPAIWNDEAKDKMKSWAIKSGLINKKIDNQCVIVYEPDCAALAVHKQKDIVHYDTDRKKHNKKKIKKKKKKKSVSNIDLELEHLMSESKENLPAFVSGDKYILIDAGGGTVDIACHEVFGKCGIKEIHYPSGGKWGSTYIDEEYIKLLEQIFSKEWMDVFREKESNHFVELVYNFQKAKERFYLNPTVETHDVQLPFIFISFMNQMGQNTVIKDEQGEIEKGTFTEIKIRTMRIKDIQKPISIYLNDEMIPYLRIKNVVWEIMFNVVLDKIIDKVKELLDVPLVMRNCKYYCLVGGLSCSKYFQYRMETEFGPHSKYKLTSIIPFDPLLSVVIGAAYFGITKNFVKARRLRHTYGIVGRYTKEAAKMEGIPQEYIDKNLIYEENRYFVRDCIRTLAHKNEEIVLGKQCTMRLKRIDPNKHVIQKILRSDMGDPKTVSDGKIVGELCVHFDEKINDLDITTNFYFSDTLLKITAFPTGSPQNVAVCSINYTIN